jgi:hypothetical protein
LTLAGTRARPTTSGRVPLANLLMDDAKLERRGEASARYIPRRVVAAHRPDVPAAPLAKNRPFRQDMLMWIVEWEMADAGRLRVESADVIQRLRTH